MTPIPGDVPIIGRPQQIVIADVRVYLPNMIEVIANGLDCGDSIAHLRIANPLKAEAVWVPLTAQQLIDIAGACESILSQPPSDTQQQQGGNNVH